MPSARKLQNKVERSWRICVSIISRDWATWNRQRVCDPGRITSRSVMRSGSPSNSLLS